MESRSFQLTPELSMRVHKTGNGSIQVSMHNAENDVRTQMTFGKQHGYDFDSVIPAHVGAYVYSSELKGNEHIDLLSLRYWDGVRWYGLRVSQPIKGRVEFNSRPAVIAPGGNAWRRRWFALPPDIARELGIDALPVA
jgi:hypothetical protein